MCRGKEVTGRDKDAPLAGSTWLGGWGDNSGTYSHPPCLPPRPPGGRWSTGVIMYTLLAGSPPFWHRKQMLMLRMIMSGHYQFGSPEWDDYSDTVKDLVRGLRRAAGLEAPAGKGPRPDATRSPSHTQVSRFLVVNPQSRCSAEEALAHPFFQQYVVEEVRHFSPRGKFKVLQLASQPGPRGGCCRLPNPSPPVPLGTPYSLGASRAPAPTAPYPQATGHNNPCACWWGADGPACAGGGERQVLRPGLAQVIALTVLASVRIYYQYRRVKPVTREIVIRDPYALRPLRRLIDAYAFRIYGHWVKKGQQQNRAALFENTPKAVLLSLAEDEDY